MADDNIATREVNSALYYNSKLDTDNFCDDDDMIIEGQPHLNDVLCGRGGGTNNHPGNLMWRSLVSANKSLYYSLPKNSKLLLAQSIVNTIRSKNPPGRFLKKKEDQNKDSPIWYDIGNCKAREKTSQALREGAPTIKAQMQQDQQQKAVQLQNQLTSSTDTCSSKKNITINPTVNQQNAMMFMAQTNPKLFCYNNNNQSVVQTQQKLHGHQQFATQLQYHNKQLSSSPHENQFQSTNNNMYHYRPEQFSQVPNIMNNDKTFDAAAFLVSTTVKNLNHSNNDDNTTNMHKEQHDDKEKNHTTPISEEKLAINDQGKENDENIATSSKESGAFSKQAKLKEKDNTRSNVNFNKDNNINSKAEGTISVEKDTKHAAAEELVATESPSSEVASRAEKEVSHAEEKVVETKTVPQSLSCKGVDNDDDHNDNSNSSRNTNNPSPANSDYEGVTENAVASETVTATSTNSVSINDCNNNKLEPSEKLSNQSSVIVTGNQTNLTNIVEEEQKKLEKTKGVEEIVAISIERENISNKNPGLVIVDNDKNDGGDSESKHKTQEHEEEAHQQNSTSPGRSTELSEDIIRRLYLAKIVTEQIASGNINNHWCKQANEDSELFVEAGILGIELPELVHFLSNGNSITRIINDYLAYKNLDPKSSLLPSPPPKDSIETSLVNDEESSNSKVDDCSHSSIGIGHEKYLINYDACGNDDNLDGEGNKSKKRNVDAVEGLALLGRGVRDEKDHNQISKRLKERHDDDYYHHPSGGKPNPNAEKPTPLTDDIIRQLVLAETITEMIASGALRQEEDNKVNGKGINKEKAIEYEEKQWINAINDSGLFLYAGLLNIDLNIMTQFLNKGYSIKRIVTDYIAYNKNNI